MSTKFINPDQCIACTNCLAHCPVAAATPKYPGPRFMGPAYERFRLLGFAEDETLHYCSNCKNCDISCPHGVPISSLIMQARGAQAAQAPFSLRDWIVGHGEQLAKWTGAIPSFLRNMGMYNPLTRAILDVLGISSRAPLPAFAKETLRSLVNKMPKKTAQRKVAFFHGCYTNIYDPKTGLDIIWLLEKAGYEVVIPEEFVCCGLPMVANGFWQDARTNAEKNLAVLARCKRDNIPVITGCPSCCLMFAKDIEEYFPELVMTEKPEIIDAQHFLRGCVERGELVLPTAAKPRTVLYHAPCHLRAQGQGLSGLELLKSMPNCTTINADAGCCGISGSYGFKKDKYDIAAQVGLPLFTFLRETPGDITSSECGTCRLQMHHHSGKETAHPASIIRAMMEK